MTDHAICGGLKKCTIWGFAHQMLLHPLTRNKKKHRHCANRHKNNPHGTIPFVTLGIYDNAFQDPTCGDVNDVSTKQQTSVKFKGRHTLQKSK
jgi:hypothetical protein